MTTITGQVTGHAEPETITGQLIDLVGAEGYIHGFVCVRPPCGKKPSRVTAASLAVKKDGTVVHGASGWAVGSVTSHPTLRGMYTAHRADGKETNHTSKTDALKAVATAANKSHGTTGSPVASPAAGVKDQSGASAAPHAVKVSPAKRQPAAGPPAKAPAASVPAKAGPTPGMIMWDTTDFGTVPGGISDSDKKSAESVYYSSAFSATNKALRNGALPAAKKAAVGRLAALIGRSKPNAKAVDLHRGVHGATAIFGPPGSAKGKVIQDKGFTSMTSLGGIANLYTGKDAAHITVHVPPGTHMLKSQDMITGATAPRAALRTSRNAMHEYTLAPGTRFRVDSDETDAAGNRQIGITVLS